MIDKDRLIEFLEKRAREAPVTDPPLLVNFAMYQGLAERIKRGDFDYQVVERNDPLDQEESTLT